MNTFHRSIETIEDVKKFFAFLVNDCSLNFHCDTPFNDYINVLTGDSTFSPSECEKYDSLMQKCFEICEDEEVDIYDLGLSILLK